MSDDLIRDVFKDLGIVTAETPLEVERPKRDVFAEKDERDKKKANQKPRCQRGGYNDNKRR